MLDETNRPLSANLPHNMENMSEVTERDGSRVFISYSHDPHEHCDRVLMLADRLRKEGIERNHRPV